MLATRITKDELCYSKGQKTKFKPQIQKTCNFFHISNKETAQYIIGSIFLFISLKAKSLLNCLKSFYKKDLYSYKLELLSSYKLDLLSYSSFFFHEYFNSKSSEQASFPLQFDLVYFHSYKIMHKH